jgi:hypothetical protein
MSSNAAAPVYRKSTTSSSSHHVANRNERVVGLGPAAIVFEPTPISNFAINYLFQQWYYVEC